MAEDRGCLDLVGDAVSEIDHGRPTEQLRGTPTISRGPGGIPAVSGTSVTGTATPVCRETSAMTVRSSTGRPDPTLMTAPEAIRASRAAIVAATTSSTPRGDVRVDEHLRGDLRDAVRAERPQRRVLGHRTVRDLAVHRTARRDDDPPLTDGLEEALRHDGVVVEVVLEPRSPARLHPWSGRQVDDHVDTQEQLAEPGGGEVGGGDLDGGKCCHGAPLASAREQVDDVDIVTAGDERGAQRTSDEPCTARHQDGAGGPNRSRCDAHGSRR